MQVAIIHLDGVSYDYFKRKLAKRFGFKSISEIHPYPGYRANEVSMFTGAKPQSHGKIIYKNKLHMRLAKPHWTQNSITGLFNIKYISSNDRYRYMKARQQLRLGRSVWVSEMVYDNYFHTYGTLLSPGIIELIDSRTVGINDLLEYCKENNIPIVLVSNHGMVNVSNYIAPPDCGEEWRHVDSTIAYYRKADYFPIDQNLIVHKGYPSTMILTKPGTVFYPDGFNKSKVKAMHGYHVDTPQNNGFIAVWPDRKIKRKGKIIDVAPTISALLSKELICDGRSLI